MRSTTSSTDDPYPHVLKYRSYWLSMYVVFTRKYILGPSIFVSSGSKERKNGALKVVHVSILSSFKNIDSYHS